MEKDDVTFFRLIAREVDDPAVENADLGGVPTLKEDSTV